MVLLGPLLVVTLAGCTSARDTLGTSASSCFDALALAGNAVHHRGTFAGVRLVSFDAFGTDVHMRAALSNRFGTKIHNVCAVSYRGTFRVDQVEQLLGPPPAGGVGHFAVVIVSKPQNKLLGTVVRLTQPMRFGDTL
jgi:hypothetical protein